jgi:hypothetical protein
MPKRTVNTSVVILVFILILVISAVAAMVIDPTNFDKTRWRTFIVTAAALGIVITFMWYFFLVEQSIDTDMKDELDTRRHMGKNIIDNCVGGIEKSCEKIPGFCSSIMPLQEPKDIERATLSYRLFDSWEYCAQCPFQNRGDIALFLQWCKSKKLKKQWLKQRCNFSEKTERFGDLLFEVSSKTKNTPTSYKIASKEVLRRLRSM